MSSPRPASTSRTARKAPRRVWLPLLQRVVAGVMPAADGGVPLAMRHARTRFVWVLATGVGLVVGGAVGLLLALAWRALPDVPLLLLGLMAGVVLGVAIALLAAAAWMRGRRGAGLAFAAAPLLVAAAPLVLAAAAWTAFRRMRRSSRSPGSGARAAASKD